MASNDNEILLQCCKCQRQLDMEGKTLTCLHSFCETCVNKEIQRQASGNGQCPLCDEIVQFDQLTLSPILVGYLKCRQIESTDWQCDLCLEDGIESIATNWCNNCQKFFCVKCNQFHQIFLKEHYVIELAGIGQEEIRKWMRTDMCKIHYEIEDSYCNTCNKSFCNTCYMRHVKDSNELTESTQWKCDLCLEDVIESIATNWCKNCQKFFCTKCNQFHKKFHKQHYAIELAGIGQEEIKESMRTDMCKIHNEIEDSYCNTYNKSFCYTCYMRHLQKSGDCSSLPMSVRKEALKKPKDEGPTLLKEIKDLEKNLKERKEKSRISNEDLEKQCNFKCEKLWQNYEDLIKELREKTHKMCDELRRITNEQVEKGRKFQNETEKMLKKLEIWGLNLQHLLKKGPKEKNIVLGVELVAKKLASSFPELHEKINEPQRKLHLREEFSDFSKKFLQEVENKMIGFGSLDYSDNFILFENEWNLPESNTDRFIPSIVVNPKDNHLFLAESRNCSITEMKESGEFVFELILKDEKGNKFIPHEMIFISSEILGVKCLSRGWKEEKIFFLERQKFSPFLEIKKIMNIKNKKTFSICQIKNQILICEREKFEIDFYTEKDGFIKAIDIGESGGDWSKGCAPLIRTDPSTGNFWGAVQNTRKIFCFNEKGQKIQTFETEEKILNFSLNSFQEIYFSNFEGIFAFFPEKKLYKNLHKFEKKSENKTRIFVTRKKIFVCLQINKKYLIKIFKFLD